MADPARARLPTHGPSASAFDDLTQWQDLAQTEATRSATTAQTWRNGLAGFITLTLSALILKGADINAVPAPYGYVVAALFALGIGVAVWGLWAALSAEAPSQTRMTYSETLATFGSIRAYRDSVIDVSVTHLTQARRRVLIALIALTAGALTWWISPSSTEPTAEIKVTTSAATGAIVVCGELTKGGAGELQIKQNHASAPTSVLLRDIDTIEPVDTCDAEP